MRKVWFGSKCELNEPEKSEKEYRFWLRLSDLLWNKFNGFLCCVCGFIFQSKEAVFFDAPIVQQKNSIFMVFNAIVI